MSETTFAGNLEQQLRNAITEASTQILEDVKKTAHEQLERELNRRISAIAVSLASEVSIVDREHQIVLTIKKTDIMPHERG